MPNKTITALAVALSFLVACGGQDVSSQQKPLYGTDEPYGSLTTGHPYVAKYSFDGVMGFCSGVLITQRHVLTAAHCAPDASRDSGSSPAPTHQRTSVRFSSSGAAHRGVAYHIHPDYVDSPMPTTADLMVITLDSPATGVMPARLLGARKPTHLKRGAWVHHVSWGPNEAAGAGAYKSTLLTRVTEDATTTSSGFPMMETWGEAGHGDSGSPSFQVRKNSAGQLRWGVVGIVSAEGILSTWIDARAYNWIRSVTGIALSDDYDLDGIANLDDSCPLATSPASDPDSDGDGVGRSCDTSIIANSGQLDSDSDGIPNGLDFCPLFNTSAPTLGGVKLENASSSTYWTRADPLRLELTGVQSDGRWFDDEFFSHVVVGGARYDRAGLTPSLPLADGRHSAQVWVSDGCGRSSAARTLSFGVDRGLPSGRFTRPASGAWVYRNRSLTVEIIAGDTTSGISSVKLFLDDAYGDEFSPAVPLCTLPGPWITGFGVKSSCRLPANTLPYGSHELVAKITDRAGNIRLVERSIFVRPGGFLVTAPSSK